MPRSRAAISEGFGSQFSSGAGSGPVGGQGCRPTTRRWQALPDSPTSPSPAGVASWGMEVRAVSDIGPRNLGFEGTACRKAGSGLPSPLHLKQWRQG